MNLDINSAVQTALYILIFAAVLSIWLGIRSRQAGKKLLFFRKRQHLINRGWRMIFFGVLMAGGAFLLNRYAEPVIYQVFPPSPTVTQTSTITVTSTITPTATITITPSITPTTSITPTPFIPTELFAQFTATVTANPNAIFSRPQFAREVNQKNFQPVDPAVEFANPITKMYAAFSFDKMNTGAQWTAMWIRISDNRIICAETEPWAGGTGGYGYSLCQPSPDQWLPGNYEFHMFTGTIYKITARFAITGNPPTVTPSLTPTPTRTLTPTPTLTFTSSATWTPVPSWTPIPSLTLAPTWTPSPTLTPSPIPPSWTPAATSP
jgi:type VI secretion system secreted protein VgrG